MSNNTFNSLWLQLCERTPPLREPDATMKIKVVEFKRILAHVYKQGAHDKAAVADELSKRRSGSSSGGFEDFFDLFGGSGR